jgi:hypothetical protein
MKSLWEYKELFREKWVDISETEISQIITNIDNIWNLLFYKYLEVINNHDKQEESSDIL